MDNECLICFEELGDNNMKCSCCKIKIHYKCHQSWNSRNNKCPQCLTKNSFKYTTFISKMFSFFNL